MAVAELLFVIFVIMKEKLNQLSVFKKKSPSPVPTLMFSGMCSKVNLEYVPFAKLERTMFSTTSPPLYQNAPESKVNSNAVSILLSEILAQVSADKFSSALSK